MSWVATIMLSVRIDEDSALVEQFSEWLRTEAPRREAADARGVGFLHRLDQAEGGWGGWKHPEAILFGAALNHADLPAIVHRFGQIPWRAPQHVQLFIKDQEQEVFRVWLLQEGRPVQCIPLPTFGADD